MLRMIQSDGGAGAQSLVCAAQNLWTNQVSSIFRLRDAPKQGSFMI